MGGSFLVYLNSQKVQDYDSNFETKKQTARNSTYADFHVQIGVSVGGEYFLDGGGKSSVFAQPIARFQVNPFVPKVAVHEFPFNFGLEIGFRHAL